MSDTLPIDCYVGQPRAWLTEREKKLLAAIAKLLAAIAAGARVIASENDGGLSVSFAGTPQQELRAVRYALNGRTAEDLADDGAAGAGTPKGAPGGFMPREIF